MAGVHGKVSLSQMHLLYFWVALMSREGIIYLFVKSTVSQIICKRYAGVLMN